MPMFTKGLRYLSYALCALRILYFAKEKLWLMALVVVLYALLLLVAIKGADKAPLFYLLFIIGAKEIDFYKILKVYIVLQMLVLIFCFICAFGFGIGGEFVEDIGRERCFMGFGWVNRASYIWFAMIMEFVCLIKGKVKLYQAAVGIVVAGFIYAMTVTRYSFVMSVCVLLFFWLAPYVKGIFSVRKHIFTRKTLSIFFGMVLYCFMAISIGLPFVYSSGRGIMVRLNRLLNSRLSLGRDAISKYGIKLFGNKTAWVGGSTLMWGTGKGNIYNYVDFGYLQVLLDYGLIVVILTVALYCIGCRACIMRRDLTVAYCIMIWGFLCIFEPRLIDFIVNPFLLCGVCMMGGKHRERRMSVVAADNATGAA